jgi:hypothetical protein
VRQGGEITFDEGRIRPSKKVIHVKQKESKMQKRPKKSRL